MTGIGGEGGGFRLEIDWDPHVVDDVILDGSLNLLFTEMFIIKNIKKLGDSRQTMSYVLSIVLNYIVVSSLLK